MEAGSQAKRGRDSTAGKNRIIQVLDDPAAHQPDLAAGGEGRRTREKRSPSVRYGDQRRVTSPRQGPSRRRDDWADTHQPKRRRQDSRSPDRGRGRGHRSRSRRDEYRDRRPADHQRGPRQEGKGSQESGWRARGGDSQGARYQGQALFQDQGAAQAYSHRGTREDPPYVWRQHNFHAHEHGRGPSPERQQGRGKGKKGKGYKGKKQHMQRDQGDHQRAGIRGQDNARRRERHAQRHLDAVDSLLGGTERGEEGRPQQPAAQSGDESRPSEARGAAGWFE